MIIKCGDYEIEQNGTRFNLKWLKKGKKREFKTDENGVRTRVQTDEDTIIEEMMGYDMLIDRCIAVIIGNELTKQDRIVSFSEWLEEYKKITEEYTQIFKQLKL